MTIPGHKSLCLRPLQKKAIEQIREVFKTHKEAILYASTGYGKSIVAMALLQATAAKGNRCAILADRIVLVNQLSAMLDAYGIEHGVVMAGHWRYRPSALIQIYSIQTMARRGLDSGIALMIVDECHTRSRAVTAEMNARPEMFKVGLSATPITKGLKALWHRVVCPTTTNVLIEQQLLVMPEMYRCTEIDIRGCKKDKKGELDGTDLGQRAIKITGDIVSNWVEKTLEVFGRPAKTIVFCASVAHGAALVEQFAKAGYNFAAVSYRHDDDYRQQIYDEFRKPDSTIVGLIAVDILTKGFDVVDTEVAIMARPFVKSLSSVIQQLGRIMRIAEGKTKALLLDHAGNLLRFYEDILDIYENGITELVEGKEKAKVEKTEKEKKELLCPKCGLLWAMGSCTCAKCGYQRPARSQIHQVPGTMVKLETKKVPKKTSWPGEPQQFYSELLAMAMTRGHSRQWAHVKYKAQMGEWPPRHLHEVVGSVRKKTKDWVNEQAKAYVASKKIPALAAPEVEYS